MGEMNKRLWRKPGAPRGGIFQAPIYITASFFLNKYLKKIILNNQLFKLMHCCD
jgi:hypothetical protein